MVAQSPQATKNVEGRGLLHAACIQLDSARLLGDFAGTGMTHLRTLLICVFSLSIASTDIYYKRPAIMRSDM